MALDSNSERYDVVIAGAGLAGGSLALRLARAGAKVALLDAARFPRDKICGEYLSPEAWGVLGRLGLEDDVTRSGYHPIRRVRLTTPRGRALEADLCDRDGRPGIGLGRAFLDDLIVRQAQAAGVEVIEGARVAGPIIRDGRVVGVSARHDGAALDLEAAVTIAADGRHSSLVRQTGTTRARSRFRPRLFGMKRHLDVPNDSAEPVGTVGLHLLKGGYCGTCRIEQRLTNLCALMPESILRRHRGRLDRLADEQFARNPALEGMWAAARPAPESAWKTVAGVRVETSTPRLPGLFYAGDCQGTIDPLGGQGMTMALLGAELLAPFVTQALARGAVDLGLQRTYAAAWHARFDHRIALCRLFHHILVNPGVIDLASSFKSLSRRLLAAGFESTRDPRTA